MNSYKELKHFLISYCTHETEHQAMSFIKTSEYNKTYKIMSYTVRHLFFLQDWVGIMLLS